MRRNDNRRKQRSRAFLKIIDTIRSCKDYYQMHSTDHMIMNYMKLFDDASDDYVLLLREQASQYRKLDKELYKKFENEYEKQ